MSDEIEAGDTIEVVRDYTLPPQYKSLTVGEVYTVRAIVILRGVKSKYMWLIEIQNPKHDYGPPHGKYELFYPEKNFKLVAKKREPYSGAVYDFKSIAKKVGNLDW